MIINDPQDVFSLGRLGLEDGSESELGRMGGTVQTKVVMPDVKANWKQRLWGVSRWGVGLGAGLTGLLWGFHWTTQAVVREQVLPNVQRALAGSLGRSVTLGAVRFVYPWQVEFGPSEVEGLLQVEQVGVGVNLWRWLWTGTAAVTVRLDQPRFTLQEGATGWWDLPVQAPGATGSLPIQGVTVMIRNGGLVAQPLQGSLAPLENLQGMITADLTGDLQVTGQVTAGWAGGRVLGAVKGAQGTWQATLRGQGLNLAQVGSDWSLPVEPVQGKADLYLLVQPGKLGGWIKLDQVGMQVQGVPQPLTAMTGEIQIRGSQLVTDGLGLNYGMIPLQAQGALDWGQNRIALIGVIPPQEVAQIAPTVGLPADFPLQGRIQAQVGISGSLTAPVLTGSFSSVGTSRLDRLALEGIQGGFRWQAGELTLRGLQVGLGEGVIRAEGQGGSLTWEAENLDPGALAAVYDTVLPFAPGRLQGQGQVELGSGSLRGRWLLAGGEVTGTGEVDWQGSQGQVRGEVQLPQGGVVQGQISWDPDQIQGDVRLSQLPIPPLMTSEVAGHYSGRVQATVPRAALNPLDLGSAQIQTQGQLQLTQLQDAIALTAVWDGTGIRGEAVHPWARVQGQVGVDPQRLSITELAATWRTDKLPLAALALPLDVKGSLSATGTLSGSPAQLQVTGTVGIENLAVTNVAFHPQLQGSLTWNALRGQGEIDLRGGTDRIAARWGSQTRLEQFVVQRGSTLAEGRGDAQTLAVTFTAVPMAWLQGLFPARPPLSGDLDGQVDWDWGSQTANGTVTVAKAGLGGLQAESVQGQFRYQPRQLEIEDLALTLVNSRYHLTGQVLLPPNQEPQLNLRLSTQQGSLEDWVQTFRWRDWQDLWERRLTFPQLGPASKLEVTPLSVLGLALLEQLRRYEQILAELAELAQDQPDLRLPPLRSLRGSFQAQASLTGSLTDPRFTFEVSGQDWSLADRQTSFTLDRIQASGSLINTTLTLAPLELSYENRRATFRGSLAPDQQQGSLVIQSMPLSLLQPFLPRLLRLQGDLSLTADFSGSLNQPQITGQASLANTRLNQIPLESGTARFHYQNAQLNLDSTLMLSPEAPVKINGQIPLALPFSQETPNPESLNLTLKMENDGLELVNLLTTALRWEGEQENLDLTIQGSLANPTLLGSLRVKGGSLRLPQFPEPIQDISGEILFNTDQLNVTSLTATWQQGSLSVQGSLPINLTASSREALAENPLTLTLDSLRLNTPLYQGQAQGSLTVHGRLLNPLIGGAITLSQGTFDLGNLGSLAETPPPAPSTADPVFQPEWNGLTLRLTSPTDVRHPLFRFLASGEIALFGPLAQPQPSGRVTLERGQVNLFATTFRLDRSRPNTVTFDRTLDPLLDVRLTTQVTEFFRNPATGLAFDANRNLPGSQQTIQVRADVNGRVSALAQNDPRTNSIQLSSTPFRSREEIIGLLGGDAIAGLAANNSLVGLAGSAFFFTIQDTLLETFGLDDVRLGPVVQPSRDGSSSRFSVGLGLEIAKDLGPALSVSVQQNLTDPQAKTRYGIRYRLNDTFLIRASTDLKGDSSLALEFETRF